MEIFGYICLMIGGVALFLSGLALTIGNYVLSNKRNGYAISIAIIGLAVIIWVCTNIPIEISAKPGLG